MPNNAANVSVGKPNSGGAVFRAPALTTLPTDATTALGAAFACAGHISDEGWRSSLSRETADIKAWGGETVLTTQTSKTETVQMTFIEILNLEVLKTLHGDENVTGTVAEGLTVVENADELPEKVWVIETILTGGVLSRKVIPRGKVTEVGDVVYKDDEPIGVEATITALPDASGNTSYEYIKGQSA